MSSGILYADLFYALNKECATFYADVHNICNIRRAQKGSICVVETEVSEFVFIGAEKAAAGKLTAVKLFPVPMVEDGL